MKLSATEKLARDICWGGFISPPPHGGCRTKAAYWSQKVHPDAKKRYLEHAAELIWWTRRLGAERLAAAVAEHDGTDEQSAPWPVHHENTCKSLFTHKELDCDCDQRRR